jgi:hypothetical protein
VGYYTNYSLDIEIYDKSLVAQKKCVNEEHTGYPDDALFCHICGKSLSTNAIIKQVWEAIDEKNFPVGFNYEPCKWYLHDADMRLISIKYKGILFILKGEGEENGDLWVKYYLNGKCQVALAEITYAEFDCDKLE